MPTDADLRAAAEAYFDDLNKIRVSGGATGERSSYPPLTGLLNAIGGGLKPKVFCLSELADQGAGHPDMALYAAKQVKAGRPREGQPPECGVVEVKAADDDAWLTAEGEQVSRYWKRYGLVLVTNTRDFVLLGEDAGRPVKLETFRLAESAGDFQRRLLRPRAFARESGVALGEYLTRALSHRTTISDPKDLAALLASYARDGLDRVEAAGDAPSLAAVRGALEEALGVHFEGDRGGAFFRSSLVQTLFYGVFSAWVLWARQEARPGARFNWREAVWHLRAPVLRALFQQLSDPGRLQPLGLVEVLDWTSAALDRVDRDAFFARFDEGEAVPYFYEPFLQAFDPALRKQLGVWYTPAEVVRYMVARVDRALKDDLGIAAGLAADNVYVLDPCCGTGAYLAEVLRRIAANHREAGTGALTGAAVKRAATERVFGFEIMPAPFVVAHLQVGLTMESLDAALAGEGERPGVFLTNALTGWEPRPQKPLPFPELEEERDRADRVKQETPILVILGNPPYNGFADMAVDEESATSRRPTARPRPCARPEGRASTTSTCASSAWPSAASPRRPAAASSASSPTTPGSTASPSPACASATWRRSTPSASTACNGDKYSTGKTTPDGRSRIPASFRRPTIRSASRSARRSRRWCASRRSSLPAQRRSDSAYLWGVDQASDELRLRRRRASTTWRWPIRRSLPSSRSVCPSSRWPSATTGPLGPPCQTSCPASFPGVKTNRDSFLVDIDLDSPPGTDR